MITYSKRTSILLLLFLLCTTIQYINAHGNIVNVLTRGYSNARNNYNGYEAYLTSSNVNVNSFGKLFTRPVKGEIYAGILIVNNVETPKGRRNVMYVATTSNNVYAFDADDPDDNEPIWQVNLGTSCPISDNQFGHECVLHYGAYTDFLWEVGIIATPVIDLASQTIFVVAMTKESSSPFVYKHRLHALDIKTGVAKKTPVIIEGSVAGTGLGSVNGVIEFQSAIQLQRVSLAINQGIIIIAFAAFCDTGDYHGWIFGYDATSLQRKFVWNDSPNQEYGGIWQSGVGPVIDSQGYIYLKTGDGDFDPAQGSYGNTLLKLQMDLPAGTLRVIDYFAPKFQQSGEYWDGKSDFGSSGCIIPYADAQILLCGSKEPKIFVVDQNNLGKLNRQNDDVLQSWIGTNGHLHGPMVFWTSSDGQSFMYIWSEQDSLRQYKFNKNGVKGTFDTTPVALGSTTLPQEVMPGGFLCVSSNDEKEIDSGVVWSINAIDNEGTPRPGILRAYSAKNIGQELYTSRQNAQRDELGYFAKFNQPVVANGRVYAATFAQDANVNSFAQVYGNLKPRVVSIYPSEAYQLNKGSNVTLTIRATGYKGMTYQWLSNDSPIPGATSQVLALTDLQQDSDVVCRVTNQYGSSDSTTITIKILKQPDAKESIPTKPQTSTNVPKPNINAAAGLQTSVVFLLCALFVVTLL